MRTKYLSVTARWLEADRGTILLVAFLSRNAHLTFFVSLIYFFYEVMPRPNLNKIYFLFKLHVTCKEKLFIESSAYFLLQKEHTVVRDLIITNLGFGYQAVICPYRFL